MSGATEYVKSEIEGYFAANKAKSGTRSIPEVFTIRKSFTGILNNKSHWAQL